MPQAVELIFRHGKKHHRWRRDPPARPHDEPGLPGVFRPHLIHASALYPNLRRAEHRRPELSSAASHPAKVA